MANQTRIFKRKSMFGKIYYNEVPRKDQLILTLCLILRLQVSNEKKIGLSDD